MLYFQVKNKKKWSNVTPGIIFSQHFTHEVDPGID